MLLDTFLNSPPGAYACLVIVGACFGIQLADATEPVHRWVPTIASFCTLLVAFLYARWIMQIAPLGPAVFAVTTVTARTLWIARLYAAQSDYAGLSYGQRLYAVLRPSYPVGDFSEDIAPPPR